MHILRQTHRVKLLFPYTLFMVGCFFVFSFMPAQSTYAAVLRDNATGGDCASIGVWDARTKTCTLTRDVNDSIWIEGNEITFDGKNHALVGNNTGFGVIIDSRENNIVRNLTVRGFDYGIYIADSLNNTVTKNIITNNTQTGIILLGSHGTMVTENEISNNTISGLEIFYIMAASQNKVYRNNFINNGYQIFATFDPDDFFSQALPLGGNYWSNFDEPAEGCYDTNRDNICDSPRTFEYGEDAFPWTTPNGWLSAQNQPPALSFSEEREFISDGIDPNKGTPMTARTFKVVYTDEDNDAPVSVSVVVSPAIGSTRYTMSVDTSAPEPLRDGNYRNGEQYTVSKVFPKGEYSYFFETRDANSSSIHLPATGALHFTTGYSNVAFLPGHQGSRLYKKGVVFEDKLWEPNLHDMDLDELSLSASGESVRTDIYTRDIIDEAYTELQGFNIYKKFIDFMDEMVDDGVIKEWKPLPYDWRLDLNDITEKGTADGEKISYLTTTDEPYILSELKRLADNSPTGKVSLVAHSYGGLVTKYLLQQLEERGDPLLLKIDKLIMVAVPQLGTPAAIEALLHGDENQIPPVEWGFLLDEEQVREFGENMISAYNLLPSKKYFDFATTPVIGFEESVDVVDELKHRKGTFIHDYADLAQFLAGDNGVRSEPDPNDEESPNVLKQHFLDRAAATHDNIIDAWIPPAGIEVIQIAGSGIKTVHKITYSCGFFTCNGSLSTLDRAVKQTLRGDGTVVIPSAIAMDGVSEVETYYVDIKKNNFRLKRNRSHADILEVNSLQQFIKSIIQGDRNTGEQILTQEPSSNSSDKSFDFRMHSPVDIHLYDTEGSHTGIIPSPANAPSIRFYEARIPNSYYKEYGNVKYAGADAPLGATTVVLKGLNLGVFTLEIDETHGNELFATIAFTDIPVTASTAATLSLETLEMPPILHIDIDGDGVEDAALEGGVTTDRDTLTLLKGVIRTLGISKKDTKKFLKIIERIEKALEKEDQCFENVNKNGKNKGKHGEKCERKADKLKEQGLAKLLKTIEELERRGSLLGEEADNLRAIIGRIRGEVVE